MNVVSDKEITAIVKKHFGFTLLLAIVPIMFLVLIGFYEEEAYRLISLVSPISTIAAVSYFIKNVLIDVYVQRKA